MDALAIANYYVEKAKSDPEAPSLTLLRLVKYVYIAYGFALAIINRCIINERFDKVEAWKYGPVIPSVYHSFKYNGNKPITDKVGRLDEESADGSMEFVYPYPEDKEVIAVLDFVWDRYKSYPTSELINLLHAKGTPWFYSYKQGENNEIYEELTKLYYTRVFDRMKKLVYGDASAK